MQKVMMEDTLILVNARFAPMLYFVDNLIGRDLPISIFLESVWDRV